MPDIGLQLPHAQWELDFYRSEVEKIHNGIIVEVGVYVGRSFRYIAPTAIDNGNELFAIDHWDWDRMGINEEAVDGGKGLKSEFSERTDIQAIFVQHLIDDGIFNDVNMLKMDSIDAAERFLDGTVDLIFIDADHNYESVVADIRTWKPKIRHGGVMLGHDYAPKFAPVVQAVHDTLGVPEQVEHTIWKVTV